MEFFVTSFNNFQLLTNVTKSYILDVAGVLDIFLNDDNNSSSNNNNTTNNNKTRIQTQESFFFFHITYNS